MDRKYSYRATVLKEVDNMSKGNLGKVSYISFDVKDFDEFTADDVKMTEWLDSGQFIIMKIGNKEFNIFVSHEEAEKAFEEHVGLSDSQYETVITVRALKKLVNFLELGLDIGLSTTLIGK